MAEFDINLGDTTITIDDDGLYDAMDYRVDQAIEQWMSDNLDVTDAISDGIWSFRQWDEIIEKEVMRNIDNWGLAVKGDSSLSSDELSDGIESLLKDFMNQSPATRCGVGKAFADAATLMIEEYVEGPRFVPAGSCKCEDMTEKLTQIMAIFEGTVKEMQRTLGDA